jgi:hypothetical protein
MYTLPKLPNFKNFTTDVEAIAIMKEVMKIVPQLWERTDLMQTNRVVHDDPEVWRCWWQLGEVRVNFHFIYACQRFTCFFHPHPWRAIIYIIDGGYRHNVACYNGPIEDVMSLTPATIQQFSDVLIPLQTTMSQGDVSVMTDIRQFHQVDVPKDKVSFSLMITSAPYHAGTTKQFSQRTPELVHLTEEQVYQMKTAALAVDWGERLKNFML